MNDKYSEPLEAAEIVYEKPLSGEFDEVLFGSDSGNTLWVRFSDKHGIIEWIGKFGCGCYSAASVTKAIVPDKFLVCAGGFAYLVNATTRELVSRYCEPSVQDAVYDSQRNVLVVANYNQLQLIEAGKKAWASERIGVDVMRSLKIEGRILSGLAVVNYEDEESIFKFDLDELKILSWEKPLLKNSSKKKSWWKFW